MISLDCETTGMDLRHGARPFFVTYCHEDQEPEYYEWDVDPLTRQPIIPKDELYELTYLIDNNNLVLHNGEL